MNQQEAQEILLRHRPDSALADTETRQALDLLNTNPELARWYKEQEQFGKSFRSALQAIEPPKGFQDQILARRKVVHPPWRTRSFIVAAAAAVTLLALGLVFWQRTSGEEPSFAVFQSRMVSFALRQYRMDIETPDERAVREYLQTHGTPSNFALPGQLATLPVKGGASLTWKNRPVSMLCFDWQGKETLYLFVIEQNHVEQAALPEDPAAAPYRTVGTAAWQSGEVVYLLVSESGEETLRTIL